MGIKASTTEIGQKEVSARNYTYRYWAGAGAGILLGMILVISGLGKLLYQGEFLEVLLTGSFLNTSLVYIVAKWFPWVEVLFGLLLITGFVLKTMASLSAALIAAFIADNAWRLSQGLGYEPCGCFGILEKMVMGTFSSVEALYVDIGMLALVLIILLSYPERFLNIYPWFLEKERTGEDKEDN